MDIVLIVVLAIVVLAVFWGFKIYNTIISNDNLVQRAWSDVIAQERQRSRIIPELERILSSHKEYESNVLPQIVALRNGLQGLSESDIQPAKLAEVTTASKNLMQGLQLTVEAYPELKASESFSKMMDEITNQEDNVGAALRIFNQNVEEFNSSIEIFPNNIVNNMFNKKHAIDTFYDNEASQSFDYKPNF